MTQSHPGEDIREFLGPVNQSFQPAVAELVELPVQEYFHQEEVEDDVDDIEDLTRHEGHGVLEVTPAVVVVHNELGYVLHHDLSLLQDLGFVLGISAGFS